MKYQKLKLWWNSKIQNCNKTQKLKLWQTQIVKKKLKMWQNWRTQIKTKKTHKLNCDKTQKLKLCHKLKLWWNSNCDEIQTLNLWQNSKTQIMTKPKNSSFEKLKKSNHDKNQTLTKLKSWWKIKLWQNSKCEEKIKNSKCDKIQILTKLENSSYDKTQKLMWKNSKIQIVTKIEILRISIYEEKNFERVFQ